MPPPFDYRHAVLHYTTVFTTKLSGISAMVRCFIACVRQTLGRVGACSRRVTSHHRVIPPNYRGFSRWFAVLLRVWQTWGRAGACSRRVTSHHRVIPPNYRGFSRWFAVLSRVCAGRTAGASPRPTLLTGLSFGAMTDRRRRCRCSASGRGQFVARTWFLRVENFEHALFFANCPLCFCRAGACPRRVYRRTFGASLCRV